MNEPHPGDEVRGAEELECALAEFMQATDSFIASCKDAIRRFADEPAALKQFRKARQAASLGPDDACSSPAFGIQPAVADFPHPLWDRELDG
jgi:hypothetical protein